MFESIEQGIELCKPDGGRCNHRHSALISIEDVVGSQPRRTGRARSSIFRHTQRGSDEAKHLLRFHVTCVSETNESMTFSPASGKQCVITSTLLASDWTLKVAHRS